MILQFNTLTITPQGLFTIESTIGGKFINGNEEDVFALSFGNREEVKLLNVHSIIIEFSVSVQGWTYGLFFLHVWAEVAQSQKDILIVICILPVKWMKELLMLFRFK